MNERGRKNVPQERCGESDLGCSGYLAYTETANNDKEEMGVKTPSFVITDRKQVSKVES